MHSIKTKKFVPLVHICSAFSAPTADGIAENQHKAQFYSRIAVEEGYLPIAPHLLLPQFMDEATERDHALRLSCILISKCHEVWVIGDITSGMAAEIAYAKKHFKAIRYFDEDMVEVG